ncbi:hypothetical protein C8J57DRAFT_1269697, partial [Mycena rebaudengoi]
MTISQRFGTELSRREDTINAQNVVIQQLQTNSANDANVHRNLVESLRTLRANEAQLQSDLKSSQLNFIELRAQSQEQAAREQQHLSEISFLEKQVNIDWDNFKRLLAPPPRTNEALSAQVTKNSGSGTIIIPPQAVASSSRGPQNVPVPSKVKAEEGVTEDRSSAAKYLTPLPVSRLQEIQAFPTFVPAYADGAVFTRSILSDRLGGGKIALIASAPALADECKINKFLVPNVSMNPWCPTSPGHNGYMFVGLGNECKSFSEPEQLNVFVSVPQASSSTLQVKYLGLYEVVRVQPLTPAEWGTLSPSVQGKYVAITATKGTFEGPRPQMSPSQIQAAYDSGALSVPCVRLRCVGFNKKLYTGLLSPRRMTPSKRKRT